MCSRLIIYGTGGVGKVAYRILSANNIIVAFCSSFECSKKEFFGLPLLTPSLLKSVSFDYIVIASQYVDAILMELLQVGISDKQVHVIQAKHLANIDYIYKAKKLRESLLDVSPHVDVNRISCYSDALLMSRLYCSEGDFFNYAAWRSHAQKLLKDDVSCTDVDKTLSRCWSEIDLGGTYAKCTCWGDLGSADQIRLQSVAALLRGERQHARVLATSLYAARKKNLMGLFQGKRVAIVGPGNNKINWDLIRSDFDVLVVVSLGGDLRGLHPVVVPYVRLHTAYDYANNLNDVLNKLDNVVLECVGSLSMCGIDSSKFEMSIEPFRIFNGFPLFLQRILLDILLSYDIESVSLFNFDMYTKKGVYNETYKKSLEKSKPFLYNPPSIFQISSVSHDPLSQFRLTKRLVSNNSVYVDTVLGDVLNLSEEEFFNAHYNSLNGLDLARVIK